MATSAPQTLPAVLRAAAARFGDHPAYVEGERTVSFAGLLEQVRAVARGYVGLGLEPAGRVVVWAPNSIDWVVAALAVSYAGGVLVPANSRYTGHEVADVDQIVQPEQARAEGVLDGELRSPTLPGHAQVVEQGPDHPMYSTK